WASSLAPRHSVHAVPDLAVQNASAADSRTQRQHAQRIDSQLFSFSEKTFRESRHIGIVFDRHARTHNPLNFRAQLQAIKSRKIRRISHPAFRQFERTR